MASGQPIDNTSGVLWNPKGEYPDASGQFSQIVPPSIHSRLLPHVLYGSTFERTNEWLGGIL